MEAGCPHPAIPDSAAQGDAGEQGKDNGTGEPGASDHGEDEEK